MTAPQPVLMFTDLPGRPPSEVADPEAVREAAGAGQAARPKPCGTGADGVRRQLGSVIGPTGDDDDMGGNWKAVR
jgi:hypothetical protein